MGKEPRPTRAPTPWPCRLAVALSTLVGLGLMVDQARRSSATYDETTYLRVAAGWWRTGEQAEIARMGSPLTFWKLQQAPTLWLLDRLGRGDWIDDPIGHQPELLPIIRIGALWIWAVALLVASAWARSLYGPRAMAMTAVVFALSPNLLAHGALATMEMPVVAATSAMFLAFWWFLRTGDRRAFWASAALGGLAWSCKFTTVLIPPILAMTWIVDLRLAATRDDRDETHPGGWASTVATVGRGMLGFAAAMALANLVVTGFATIPLSANGGHHPSVEGRLPALLAGWLVRIMERSFPQDWVAFVAQVMHQRSGGASYLFGERRMTGWSYYYPVALAVKVPIAVGVLVLARIAQARWERGEPLRSRGWMPILVVVLFLAAACLGSKRNYGVRYLLPAATPAIVWLSALAEGGRRARVVGWLGVAGLGLSVALIHPHELSYFNAIAGGPIGGRRILSDSNLDWGQGLRGLAALQRRRPELRDLTFYYFGDIDPAHYGIVGTTYRIDANFSPEEMPPALAVGTKYLAVSSSLAWGPWGPAGYFRPLDGIRPMLDTADATIAIYRAEDLRRGEGPGNLEARRGRGYDGAVE